MVERAYSWTRIGEGDYLLPSNDRRRLYRIRSYWEDGSAFWEDAEGRRHEVRGTRWTVETFHELAPPGDWAGWAPVLAEALEAEDEDPEKRWRYWREVVSGCKTRREALQEAVEHGERHSQA